MKAAGKEVSSDTGIFVVAAADRGTGCDDLCAGCCGFTSPECPEHQSVDVRPQLSIIVNRCKPDVFPVINGREERVQPVMDLMDGKNMFQSCCFRYRKKRPGPFPKSAAVAAKTGGNAVAAGFLIMALKSIYALASAANQLLVFAIRNRLPRLLRLTTSQKCEPLHV
ncbi:hypothetical protein GA0061070_106029 [Kosakonia oryziphila]|uniref:Uncharacterized protein n=2 Tax=Kosakonia oryziphila TaxID=1005667 RepID=A0A1C4GB86_9ENTR|nr:hypothetical protein GA0061070_106029 [Kosakonia oryziphila]